MTSSTNDGGTLKVVFDTNIETALVGGAGIIVSGDRHLLTLGNTEGIEILTARQFLDRLAATGSEV